MIALETTDRRDLAKHVGLTPQLLLRLLVIAAVFDWLVTRTFTRAAIFMPKPPLVILLYQILNVLGQFAFTLAGFVAILMLTWIAWTYLRTRHDPLMFIALMSLIALSIFFLFVAPAGVSAIVYQLLITVSLGLMIKDSTRHTWINVAAPALALFCATLYQLSQQLQLTDTSLLFNLGELFFAFAPMLIGWRYILPFRWWMILPALAFGIIYFINPAMTGVIAIWSTGLTLYLPSIVYALSLSFVAAILIRARGGDADSAAGAVLLMLAGGYAPQISTQLFLGIIALWLLTPSLATPSAHSLHSFQNQRQPA